MRITNLVISLIFLTASMNTLAGAVEDQIKTRQSAYAFMGWNTKKLKDQLVDHPETFNKDEVVAAGNVIAALAHSGLLSLYGAGTDQGTGWRPSHLKAEYFEKQQEVKEIESKFIAEADKLQEIAKTGEIAAIKEQFGKVGTSCKGCHDLIRVRD